MANPSTLKNINNYKTATYNKGIGIACSVSMVKFLKIDKQQAMESLLYDSLQVLKISCSGVITFFVLKENLGYGIRFFKLSNSMPLLQIARHVLLLIILVWTQALGIFFLLSGQGSLSETKHLSPSGTTGIQRDNEPKGFHPWQSSERLTWIINQK
jgi:hypothetical protein